MKIYLIGECLDKVGGVERVMNALANGLISKNDNLTVISETKNSDATFYKYDEKIKINYLVKYYPLLSNKFSSKLLFYPIRTIEYIGKKVKLRKKIKTFIKKINEEDVVIFDRVYVALDWLPLFKKYNKYPRVITRDAIHLHYFSRHTKKKMMKYFPTMVDTFIVSSDESINEYKKFWGNTKINMIKIYNPLGITPKSGYDFNAKTIISLGRMDDNQKGYENIIKAMIFVHKENPNWKLVLYGDGKNKKRYQRLIDNYNANDYIFIKPSSKNIVDLFNKSSIYIMGSRFEGYANVLVEALTCGIPSISYDWYCGVEEIIKDDINGKIARLKNRYDYFRGKDCDEDAIKLANEINRLIDNPDIAKRYSDNSIKIIESRNVDNIINKWIKIINK